jgi:hypothetical protein
MKIRELFNSDVSFFTGNYRILVRSWIVMDLAMEMPSARVLVIPIFFVTHTLIQEPAIRQ